MKKVFLAAAAFVGVSAFFGTPSFGAIQNDETSKALKISTEKDSVSYAIGLTVGQSLKNFHIKEVDAQIVAQAIKDFLSNDTTNLKMSEGEAMGIVQMYFSKVRQESQNKALKEGEDFLAKNKQIPGVVELPSGLQYKIINAGDVKLKPAATDTVVVHYTGSLIDGKVFDSSKKYGQPITFPLNRVIPGWTEGVQLIGKGGSVMLYIPSKLAYGENGAGNAIPGNATLIFEIELVDVKVAAAPQTQVKVASPEKATVKKQAPAKTTKSKKK